MFFPKRKLIPVVCLSSLILVVVFLSSNPLIYCLRVSMLDFSKIPLVAVSALSAEAEALFFFHRDFYENIKLKKQNEELRSAFIRQEDLRGENERLARLLDLKARLGLETTASRVIGKDFNTLRAYIILDKGARSGIKKYAAVLTDSGLVGKVLELGAYSSKVILINDPDLSVPAADLRSGEQGLVSGTLDGRCKLRFLGPDSDVEVGDIIVTSGLNMSYPRGILIGTVKLVAAESSGLGKFAILEPGVRISTLEEVLVIRHHA